MNIFEALFGESPHAKVLADKIKEELSKGGVVLEEYQVKDERLQCDLCIKIAEYDLWGVECPKHGSRRKSYGS